VRRAGIPTAKKVLGFDLGTRQVTYEQANEYLAAVDRASRRVRTGTLAESVRGRSLNYAVVGNPQSITASGLQRIQRRIAALRDPLTPADQAASIAADTPAILWIASNVHGDEESGTDATLRVLYDLASRTDCAATRILDNALVVLLPMQNPDGRETNSRRNAYGFDLNRDWFARTQPETDGKVELLRRFPPVLFIDAHEMGAGGYFFPPNADPIYHEITDESVDWINNTYGAAMAAEFNRQNIPFFNRDIYDLFYMGYGDTVPSTGFISAGMTFEKSAFDPITRRTREQYITQWISLSAAAADKDSILTDWAGAWRRAYRQGVRGKLEPNEIVNRSNELTNQVPNRPVRHYFLRADDPDKQREVQALVRRLQRMDVVVYELTEPLAVPDYRAYGRAPEQVMLPAGTYWIPMAQMQKHWVQAMLHEDTYTPFPYFYDVTAWSQPLLFNVSGGYSGKELEPNATPVPQLDAPPGPPLPDELPRVGLYEISPDNTVTIESAGWLRYILDQVWGLPYERVTSSDIAGPAGLSGFDVLLVPDGAHLPAFRALGPNGRRTIGEWVNGGGRWVSWRGGTRLAARLGITTAQLTPPGSDIPGSLVRVAVDTRSPLAAGVGDFAWTMYSYDDVMTPSDPAHVAVSFPAKNTEDFFISGYAAGAKELGGTAAVVDEPVGGGRVIAFSVEPNFRAFTDGTQKLVFNAVLGPEGPLERAPEVGAAVRAGAERTARAAARSLSPFTMPLRLTVERTDARAAARLLQRFDASYESSITGSRAAFAIANPRGLSGDAHPFAAALGRALIALDVRVVAFVVP
jgi:zinc carboxypeptidase